MLFFRNHIHDALVLERRTTEIEMKIDLRIYFHGTLLILQNMCEISRNLITIKLSGNQKLHLHSSSNDPNNLRK